MRAAAESCQEEPDPGPALPRPSAPAPGPTLPIGLADLAGTEALQGVVSKLVSHGSPGCCCG